MRQVTSLTDLYNLAAKDERYSKLLIISAENLGGVINSQEDAIRHLEMNADAMGERDVLGEVNFCLDLVE
jgi:hypothetical protein|tara:strand:+ start:212 stop:421 length:210 start_codon:yes stop_codon:yes gene_type:complete